MDSGERSPGGSSIRRYKQPPKDFEFPNSQAQWCQQIADHVDRHIGPVKTVLHEIVSHLVHIDILIVEPSESKPYYTLVTSGLSDRPMTVPATAADQRYAELMIRLPPDWPMPATHEVVGGTTADAPEPSGHWPFRLLKYLARFPHNYDTWLGLGHTMPNGDPPAPFAPDTGLCGVILLPSLTVPRAIGKLAVHDNKQIHFLSVYPIYKEEMDLKLNEGSAALIERFEADRVTDIVNHARANTCPAAQTPAAVVPPVPQAGPPPLPRQQEDRTPAIRARYREFVRARLGRPKPSILKIVIGLICVGSLALIPLGLLLLFRGLFPKHYHKRALNDELAFIDRAQAIMAYPVMINTLLRRPGDQPAVGLFLVSFDPTAESGTLMVDTVMNVLRPADNLPSADTSFLAGLLCDEDYQRSRRRPVPKSITGGVVVYACDTAVHPWYLPNKQLNDDAPFIPCLAEPGPTGQIRPIPYWCALDVAPPELASKCPVFIS